MTEQRTEDRHINLPSRNGHVEFDFEIDSDGDLMIGATTTDGTICGYISPANAAELRDWLNEVLP